MIDGDFGFEMEFLNILPPHGLPGNILGRLTHLDLFKSEPERIGSYEKEIETQVSEVRAVRCLGL